VVAAAQEAWSSSDNALVFRRSYSALCADEAGVPIEVMKEVLTKEGRDEASKLSVLAIAQSTLNAELSALNRVSYEFPTECSKEMTEFPRSRAHSDLQAEHCDIDESPLRLAQMSKKPAVDVVGFGSQKKRAQSTLNPELSALNDSKEMTEFPRSRAHSDLQAEHCDIDESPLRLAQMSKKPAIDVVGFGSQKKISHHDVSRRILANSEATASSPRGRAHTCVDHPEATAEFPRSRAHSDLNAKSSI